MKVAKLRSEIKTLTSDQLEQRADELRRELFTLRLNATTAHVKDYSQIKKLRKNVARVLTQKRHIEQV